MIYNDKINYENEILVIDDSDHNSNSIIHFIEFKIVNNQFNILMKTHKDHDLMQLDGDKFYITIKDNDLMLLSIPKKIIIRSNNNCFNIKLDQNITDYINFEFEKISKIDISPLSKNKTNLDLTKFNFINGDNVELCIMGDNCFNVIYPDFIGGLNSNLNIKNLALYNVNLPDNSIINLEEYKIHSSISENKKIKDQSNIKKLEIINCEISTINNLSNKYFETFTYSNNPSTNQIEKFSSDIFFDKINLYRSGIKEYDFKYNKIDVSDNDNKNYIHILNKYKDYEWDKSGSWEANHELSIFLINHNINVSLTGSFSEINYIENTHVLNFIHNNYNCIYDDTINFNWNPNYSIYEDLKFTYIKDPQHLFDFIDKKNTNFFGPNFNNFCNEYISITRNELLQIVKQYSNKFEHSALIESIISNKQHEVNEYLRNCGQDIKNISKEINLYQFIKDKSMITFLHELGAKIHVDDFDDKKHSDYYIKQKSIIENIYLSDEHLKKFAKKDVNDSNVKRVKVSTI